MNNFNYTSVPGDLLYCDRRHLDDFGVEDPSSLNHIIEKEIDRMYGTCPDYENFARDLFNTAYYICTIALADSHPQRRFGAYLSIVDRMMHGRADDVGVVLSIVLAQIGAHAWDEARPDIDSLATKLFDEIQNNHADIFFDFFSNIQQEFEKEEEIIIPPESDFVPREITMGVLRRTCSHWDWKSHFGTDMDKMLDFINAIGKNENEQKVIAAFLEEETHPSFAKGADHKFCFEYIERQVYLNFHAEEEKARINAEIDADIEEQALKEIEYSYAKERLPILEKENSRLRSELDHVKERLEDLEKQKPDERGSTDEDNDETIDSSEFNKELYNLNQDFNDVNKWAKVIFFATVLNVAYQKKFTVGQQLANFICLICGGSPTTYQPLISKIGAMEDNEKDKSGETYCPQVIKAAKEIVKRLVEIPEGDSVHPTIQGYIDSICDEFSIEKPKKKRR